MSKSLRIFLIAILFVILFSIHLCDAGKVKKTKDKANVKQLELRETNPPNFVRLVLMRLIYGIASQMGYEERVSGWFNGAFAPPNADDLDLGGLGDLADGELFKR